ncbi:MAG: thioredoxin family protein [Pleomorphochaeta sp.]
MEIKVLGSGCPKCKKLEANVVEALKNKGLTATIDHVTDYAQIASYNIMSTPGLVIDGKVVSAGKLLKPKAIEELLN